MPVTPPEEHDPEERESPATADPRRGLVGPFTGRQLAAALGTVLVVAAILVVATAPLASVPAPGIAPQPTQFAIGPVVEGLRVGDRAPELEILGANGVAAPLRDLAGAPVRLADLRGHPVWVSFWASWCPPCQAETPVLRETFSAYGPKGLALVAVSVQESTVDDVRAYATKYGLDYTVAADLAGDVFRRYRVYGLPTQIFLDADGIIRAIVQGPVDTGIAAASLALVGLPPAGASSSDVPSGGPPTSQP